MISQSPEPNPPNTENDLRAPADGILKYVSRLAKLESTAQEDDLIWAEIRALPEQERIEIATTYAGVNAKEVCINIQAYGVTDQKGLIKIAKAAATQDGFSLSFCIQDYGIQEQKNLIAIALIAAAHNGAGVSINFFHFGIENEKDRAQIAEAAARQNPGETARNIENYKLTDQKALVRLAKIIATLDAGAIALYIPEFCIKDPKQRIEIAKLAAAKRAWTTSYEIEKFEIEDQESLLEIAKIAVTQDPLATSIYFGRYGIKSTDARKEVLSAGVAKNVNAIKYLHHYVLPVEQTKSFFHQFIEKCRAKEDGVKDLAIALKHFTEEPALIELDTPQGWRALEPHEQLKVIAPAFIEILEYQFDLSALDYQHEVQSDASIYSAFAATLLSFPEIELAPGETTNRSRLALKAVSGIESLPLGKLSSENTTTRLYESVFSISSQLPGRISDYFEIAPDAWEQQEQLLDLLHLATTITVLKKSTDTASSEQLPAVAITSNNLKELTKQYAEEIDALFNSFLKLDESQTGAAVLYEKWGDLTPFMVLAARYAENPAWQEELETLREIAKAVLNDEFQGYKYSGQSLFTPEQLIAWKKNPSSLKLHSAEIEAEVEKQDPYELAERTFRNNFLAHLPDEIAPQASDTHLSFHQLMELSESEFSKTISLATFSTVLSEIFENEIPISETALFFRRFNSARPAVLREISDPNTRQQLLADLLSLSENLKPAVSSGPKDYLVFSTVVDDAKVLLTIGDMVDTASCQNYKTGNYIDSLPGYVIDSNIKATLTFPVSWRMVQSRLGIQDLTPNELQYQYNPAKGELQLEARGKNFTHKLGKATSRKILRAGKDSKGALVIMPETPYQQRHDILTLIDAQEEELIASFRHSIGAKKPSGKISFPASKNPGGVYTDKGNGVETEEYKIQC